MRDNAKQVNTKEVARKFEDTYFDNFAGLDCVDDGLNMAVGTGVVFFLLIIIKFRTVPAVPGSTFTALYSTIVGDRHDLCRSPRSPPCFFIFNTFLCFSKLIFFNFFSASQN